MCRSTAGPLLAMVGVAGTAAGVILAIVRERVDRLADARAARQAAEEQADPGAVSAGPGETEFVEDEDGGAGVGDNERVESESSESK